MNTGITEINILGIILFILLIFHGKTVVQKQNNHIFFNRTIFFLIITLATEIILNFMTGTTSQGAKFIHYFLIMVYSFSTVISTYYWLIFVHNEVLHDIQCTFSCRILYILPLFFWAMVVLSSPFNHWIFFVDEKNQYIQGNFHFLQNLAYGYILISAMISYVKYRIETILETRKLCFHLFIYSLLPLLGKIVEAIFPWIHTATIAIEISIIMLYLGNMKKEIFLDPLTQLYNRRQFQQYLIQNAKCAKKEKIFLIFFDINNFKVINDNFGHVEGDHALIMVAQVLKSVFSNSKAFLARYGGDEFAVILLKEESEILSYLDKVESSLIEISKALPYTLSLSAGYSVYGEDDATTIESLIQAADKKMYYDKQEKKNDLC